jgi:aryl-alcohol dehydrogenase-like predicted oxidoreductase
MCATRCRNIPLHAHHPGLGGCWRNDWDNDVAQEILENAYRAGGRFIDTADVSGDGASERSIGQFLRTHRDLTVVTKLGRAGIYPDGHTRAALRDATLRSLDRLGADQLDLTQLHCVPTEVLRQGQSRPPGPPCAATAPSGPWWHRV